MDGPLLNVLTGMGTSNDRSQATGIQGGRALGEAEINALYEQSWLLRRVVEKIPMQGTRSGWDLGLGDETTTTERSKLDDLVSWTEELKLPQAVTTAATYARLYGGGALVVLADDRTPHRQAAQPQAAAQHQGVLPHRSLEVVPVCRLDGHRFA